jgi:hypothetical protein
VIDLYTSQIVDKYIRENFRRLKNLSRKNPFLAGQFNFVTITVDAAVTNLKVAHSLGSVPMDVILTNGAPVTFNFSKFSDTHLDITTTGPCTIRAFVGTAQG